MESSSYLNPPEDPAVRSFIPTASPRFQEMIDYIILEFNKKSPQYYCPTFHSIETRNSEKHLVHKSCQHFTKGDLIGKLYVILT